MVLRYKWRAGDFLRKCERTGFTVYASDTREEWTGHIIRKESWEPRHPQEFVRGVPDLQAVEKARPQPATPEQYPSVGPLTTSLATSGSIGDTSVTLVDATGMSAGDTVRIVTDTGAHQTTISGIAGSVISISSPLPASAPNRAAFIDITAATPATEGF